MAEPAGDPFDPVDMLVVTRADLDAGYKLTEDGMIPCVRMTMTGNFHLPGGGIDVAATSSLKFVMRRADARAYAARIMEATESPRPR